MRPSAHSRTQEFLTDEPATMNLRTHMKNVLEGILKRHGHEIIPSFVVYDWQRNIPTGAQYKESRLPEGAAAHLRPDNPKLMELCQRYAALTAQSQTAPVWNEGHVRPEDILYFRGDNPYVWQVRGKNMNILGYALSTYYVKSIDTLGLLGRLTEDDAFGNFTHTIDGRVVSRDLLDSIIEIYFLEKHLSVSTARSLTILDIGAGYGRLAWRLMSALPNVERYLCTDGVAVSTFICDYYLRFRNLQTKAQALPFDVVEKSLEDNTIDIAVNVHSFSECDLSSIDGWLSLLERHRVRHLMIVPNSPLLQTNEGKNFGDLIDKHGYKLVAREPKYRDPVVQEYGISPSYHYLFALA